MKADLFFIILKFTGQSSWTGFFHVVDSHEKGVFPRLIAVSEVCVPKSMLKGASVIYKIADLLHGLIAYHVLHAAGIFFCNAAFYSYIFQKLGEGFMAVAAFLAPDPSQLCEADADVFFFDFYVALGGQLFQTGQNLPSLIFIRPQISEIPIRASFFAREQSSSSMSSSISLLDKGMLWPSSSVDSYVIFVIVFF